MIFKKVVTLLTRTDCTIWIVMVY